jgi:heterodisulfide reductase subunit A-like polyferredoxin
MPYLRVYARELPIEQKRVIAKKLIEITVRTFRLRANQRYQTSVQFITQQSSGVDGLPATIPRGADFTLEVIGHDLTEEKKRAFAEEAAVMLASVAPVRPATRIARLLGLKANSSRQVALQFNELSPAISDPFIVDSHGWAA